MNRIHCSEQNKAFALSLDPLRIATRSRLASRADHHHLHHLPPLRRGEDSPAARQPSPSTELVPLQLCCNPPILGALKYKDHQLLDIGHTWPEPG